MRVSLLFVALFMLFASPSQAIDWKALGQPLDNDMTAMQDRYVYMNEETTDKNVSLDKPVYMTPDIQEWISQRIAELMTLDGPRYNQQISVNKRHFTPLGYTEYINSLVNAGIPGLLKNKGYTMSAIVIEPPTIISKGLRDTSGIKAAPNVKRKLVYVWQSQAQVLLNYKDMSGTINYKIYLDLEVTRVPMQTENQNAIVSINSWRFTNKPRKIIRIRS